MAINFPNSPAVNDTFVSGNVTWTWDGTKWTANPGVLAITDAPTDGQQYGRQKVSGSMAWSVVSGGSGGGGIPEAPTGAGVAYARRNSAWATFSHADITDWTATLAPYALTANIPAAYTLPTASTSVLGGVKIDGTTVTINGSGVISAAGASITVADTAPSSPSAGALWFDSVGGQLYVWYNDGNTSQWVPTTNQMGGGYATVAYADAARLGDNRIINGDMRIDQRNNGASITPTVNATYTVDRWFYGMTQPSKISLQRIAGAGTASLGFPYFLTAASQSAFTPATGDTFYLGQKIEADMISDFAFGTANAQPVTLSFIANATVAGTYSGALCNTLGDRSYVFTFALTTSLQKIVITIPGDTGTPWTLSGNGSGASLRFDLGSGATWRTTPGAWGSVSMVGATGAVNLCATNAAQFNITGVKLEIGSVATPYNRQALAKSQADCERYFRWISFNMNFQAVAAGNSVGSTMTFQPAMRAAPTLPAIAVDPNATANVANASAYSFDGITPYGARIYLTATAAGSCFVLGYRTGANAEL